MPTNAPQLSAPQVMPDGDAGFDGVFMRADPGAIPPGLLAEARNGRCRKKVFATRRGVAKLPWANRTEPAVSGAINPYGTPRNGVGVFKDPSSIEWLLIAAEGTVFRTHENNPASSIPLPSGVQILGPCNLVQAFNKVYLFRGRNLAPLRLTSFDTGFVDLLALWSASTVYKPVLGGVAADEVAYGPFLTLSTLTRVGTTATAVSASPHGYVTGADVTVRGAAQAEYNGRFNITVIDDVTFTYAFAGSATATATGTITASNMAFYWKALGTLLSSGVAITHSTTTATVAKTAHGFTSGQTVTVSGATGADAGIYNVTAVITVVNANSFTYVLATNPGADATGTLSVRNNSAVLAAQSPDTNPEAWVQLFNILPNADTAVYVAGRLVVPTAYNPDTGLYDAKADYIITTDVLDETHFDFVNQFRINQGSDDAIVDVCEFAESGSSSDAGTVIVFKDKSVHVLNGIAYLTGAVSDLANVTRRTVIPDYGLCAMRAYQVVGNDCYFMATNRGVVSIRQTEQNKIQGVDLPLSDPIQPLIDRIAWRLAGQVRMQWWDSKLYVAVPLDNPRVTGSVNLIPSDAAYDGNSLYMLPVTVGEYYRITFDGGNDVSWDLGNGPQTVSGEFVAQAEVLTAIGSARGLPVGLVVQRIWRNVNNAILVYDFLAAQWQGYDTGTAIQTLEFLRSFVQGRERLFFLGNDGWVNLMEETDFGDQLGIAVSADHTSGLTTQEITTYALTRGYTHANRAAASYGVFTPIGQAMKRDRLAALNLATWNPSYAVSVKNEGQKNTRVAVSTRTKDRTKYYRPWDAPAWVTSNVNLDHGTAWRQDYSVPLTAGGVHLGSGIALDLFQETRETARLQLGQSRYSQIELTNTQGRIELRAVELDSEPVPEREGVRS